MRFSGAVPSSIPENAAGTDWAATLALSGDLAALRAVELDGPGALFFAIHYDASLGVVFLSPGGSADYEGLAANAGDPSLTFRLRYTYADNTTQTDDATITVAVSNIDDTPPQGLRFAAGGTIGAEMLGGAIGTLAVDAPDTEGPFGFTVIGWDDWMFEFDGPNLRLRDGVNIGFDAMPVKTLFVEVSDGRQSAAFVLDIQVTGPNEPPAMPIIAAGQTLGGVSALGDGRAVAVTDATAFVALPSAVGGARELVQAAAPSLLLPGAASLALPEGWIDFAADGTATRAMLLHRTIEGARPDAATLASLVARHDAGVAWTDLAAGLLADDAPASDVAFLGAVHRAALGRDPSAAELAQGLAALAVGHSRAQQAVQLAFSDAALANAPDAANGVWVAQPLGLDALPHWQADRGGIGTAPIVPPPSEVMFL